MMQPCLELNSNRPNKKHNISKKVKWRQKIGEKPLKEVIQHGLKCKKVDSSITIAKM